MSASTPNTGPERAASRPVEVAVGVIKDRAGRVLVARRATGTHQGGKWEFPGGKREGDESITAALKRELGEELGIDVRRQSHLITLRFAYAEKTVILNTWCVDEFTGRPEGREGQPLEWRRIDELAPGDFPAANRGIIRALQLPALCLITPDLTDSPDRFLRQLEQVLNNGLRLVILRDHQLNRSAYRPLAERVVSLCREHEARCLLNMPPEWSDEIDCDGLHLTAARLQSGADVVAGFPGWVSAACHNAEELDRAHRLDVDFVTVSPVLKTASHPNAEPMGWERFRSLTAAARIPVYALGGMTPACLPKARECGGQGVAGIRAFWQRQEKG